MEATKSTRVKAPATISSSDKSDLHSGAHDASALNLSRRAAADNGLERGRNNFMKCKKSINVSSMNTRTLRQPHNLGELTEAANKFYIDVICIQEHRLVHDVDIDYTKVSQTYTLVTASATRNSTGAAIGGVGLLMNCRTMKCLTTVKKYSQRIMTASFTGNPATTIISCYSPTNCSDEEDVVMFYKSLSDALRDIPAHNMVLIGGDFNAKLGTDDIPFSFHDSTNRNGTYLLDLANSFDLVVSNTKFRKPRRKLWTFRYPNSTKAQLDYILVRKKWVNSVQNVEAYNTFDTVGSDHRVITAKVRLRLRAPKKMTNATRSLNFKALCSNNDLQRKYAIKVTNFFDPLTQEGNTLTFQEKYDLLQSSCIKAAEEVLPKKLKDTFKNISQSQKVIAARKAYHSSIKDGSNRQQAKQLLTDAYISEERALLETNIEQVRQASISSKHGIAWKIVNNISGRKESKRAMLSGTPDDRRNAWLKHFSTLLGNPPSIPAIDFTISHIDEGTLPISTSEFSEAELEEALSQSKPGSALGLDSIPLELWKSDAFKPHLLHLCNRLLLHHEKPTQWSTGGIIPIPKKGDLSKPSNYRGITLTSIGAKIFNRMILNRIRPFVDPLLRWNQNGFRQQRSTISQILALRRIIEGMKAKNLPLAVVFIDYSKAFDSIHRERMFEILQAYGIPGIIIDAIKAIYTDSTALVISPDGVTEPFPILAGVLQGDTLAPFLFIVVLDYVMRHALKDIHLSTGVILEERKSRRHPELRLHDLDFADDIALLSSSIQSAETLLHHIEEASNCVGLHLNVGKTKTLLVNIPSSSRVQALNSTELVSVKEFKYLGSSLPDSFHDFKCRKAQAWVACNKLEKIWKSKLDRTIKIKFFRACVESILMYGSETWTVTKALEERINGCYTQLLRRVLDISWRDHQTNKKVYGDIPPLSVSLRKRRLQFAGHCLRTTDQPVSKLIFWTPSYGHSKRGRKCTTYPDSIVKDLDLEPNEIQQLMKDKTVWRKFVSAASTIPSKDDT